jgi:hypothetical protein
MPHPFDDFHPPLAEWLSEHVYALSEENLPGKRPACLVASLLIASHVQEWLNIFHFRIHVHRNSANATVEGSLKTNRLKEADLWERVLLQLKKGIDDLIAHQVQRPVDAHYALFTRKPKLTADFISSIAGAWHLAPPAVKFALLGGFKAVNAVEENPPKDATYAEYVAIFAEGDGPKHLELLPKIKKGAASVRQVRSARKLLEGLGKSYFWERLKTPSYQVEVGGLNQNRSDRGRKKRKRK